MKTAKTGIWLETGYATPILGTRWAFLGGPEGAFGGQDKKATGAGTSLSAFEELCAPRASVWTAQVASRNVAGLCVRHKQTFGAFWGSRVSQCSQSAPEQHVCIASQHFTGTYRSSCAFLVDDRRRKGMQGRSRDENGPARVLYFLELLTLRFRSSWSGSKRVVACAQGRARTVRTRPNVTTIRLVYCNNNATFTSKCILKRRRTIEPSTSTAVRCAWASV
jgi:hypothetical protein